MTSAEKHRKFWAILLCVGIFALGMAAGVALDRIAGCKKPESNTWSRRHQPEDLAKHFKQELDLDDQQSKAVTEILIRRWTETARIFKHVDPEADAIRHRSQDEIRALLRPEQKEKFEQMVKDHEARRQAIRKRFQ